MNGVDASTDPWTALIGQPNVVRSLRAAVDNPVHAYLFLGPAGTGKLTAAGVFAGELLAAIDPTRADRHRSLAARLAHPDVRVVTPTGSLFRIEESRRLIAEASRSPVEGGRTIVIAERFHDANAGAMPVLLKIAEEPPGSTIFVFLADRVDPQQVTVASRCTTIEFRAIPEAEITDALSSEGVDPQMAARAAEAAAGSLTRARLLSTDERLMARRDAWWSIPDRLDGTGAAVVVTVQELRSMIDDSMSALKLVHTNEMKALEEQEERYGVRGSGRKDLESHHKRIERRHRNDELAFGFATLARRYRESLADADAPGTRRIADAVGRLGRANGALVRTPAEALLLEALLLDMPPA